MLETIREFGTEQLNESYGAASTRRRHAEWLVDWGGELDIRNTGQADTLRRLRDELPNIRMAFEELASGDRACDRLLLATRLAQGMFHLGFVEESKSWLAGALAQEDDCRPQLRAEALTAISMLSSLTGDPGQGARYVAQAAEIASDLDEPRVLMDVGMAAGVAHLGLLELDEAWRFTADALTQAEKIADGYRGTELRGNLSYIALLRGDLDAAQTIAATSLVDARRSGNHTIRAALLHTLVVVALKTGNLDDALHYLLEGLDTARQHALMGTQAYLLECVAVAASRTGAHQKAATLLGASASSVADVGHPERDLRVEAERTCRAALGGAAFEQLRETGARLNLDEATEQAQTWLLELGESKETAPASDATPA
jgi:non-specific serine/threonine protein kinase